MNAADGRYSPAQLAKLSGTSSAFVRRLLVAGLLERPEQGFGFAELAFVRDLGRLLKRARPRSRRALLEVARRAQLVIEHGRVVARDDSGTFEPETGQVVLPFEPAEPGPVADVVEIQPSIEVDPEGVFEGDADPLSEAAGLELVDPDAAETIYRELLEGGGRLAVDAAVNLGRLLFESDRVDEAESVYERALGLQSTCATAWFNLGVLREHRGQSSAALQAYGEALRHDPSFADAHFNAAKLYEQTGQHFAALRHFRSYRDLTR